MQTNVLGIVTELNEFVKKASKRIPDSVGDLVEDKENLQKKYDKLYNRIKQSEVINNNAKIELLKDMPSYIGNDALSSFG